VDSSEQFWHFLGISLFLLLAAIHRWTRSKGIFIAAIWNLSGVILHELAHLSVGILLKAEPVGFSLIPHKTPTGWRLGTVSFRRINAFNAVPVALAPLCLAGTAFIIYRSWSLWFTPTLSSTIGLYVTMFILLYNALPSLQDLKIACNWKSMLLYGTTAATVFWLSQQ
jgi:hypothetical protein